MALVRGPICVCSERNLSYSSCIVFIVNHPCSHNLQSHITILFTVPMLLSEGYRREISPGVTASSFDTQAGDTVGCVTIDLNGHIAATSSTGGIPDKMAGRVGDSPIFGAGAYADDICGATATGWGEHIIRVLLCRTVVSYVEDGADPQAAAERGIGLLQSKTGSQAGVVVADRDGRFGLAMNTRAMPTVVIVGNVNSIRKFVYAKDVPTR